METIEAIYDGNAIVFTKPVPVKGKYEVEITFTKPLDEKEEKRQKILKFFGAGDEDDVILMQEMIKEREIL